MALEWKLGLIDRRKTVILNRGRAYYCILRPDDMMGMGERACFLSTHLLNGLNLPLFSTPRSPHYALITYHQSADVPPHVGFIYISFSTRYSASGELAT